MFLVDRLRKQHDLHGKTVGILGMAFKAEIDDPRDSLSYKLRKLLQFYGANVLCSDEYIRDPSFVPADQVIEQSSLLIVGVPHKAYATLQVPSGKDRIDLWGILPLA
jgi:UDP-N-acetyl-D-mannosaminuronic acid dehydrogenase